MSYQAPIDDLLFDIEHLSSWPRIRALPAYADADLEDARAALTELGRFAADVIAPMGAEGDAQGSCIEAGRVMVPERYKAAYAQFVEMGWQSLPHDPKHGGMGLPRAVGAAATEIINAADLSFGLCPLLTDGAIDALETHGSPEQKALYLSKLIAGQWTGTMNLTEPQAGSDLARIRTRAERRNDGSYAISGTKIFITYGEHDQSDNIVHLVLARVPGAPDGSKGLSLFIVPKFLPDATGEAGARNAVACVSIEHKLGVHASPTAVLEFDGATGFIVGDENRGLEYMFVMMGSARFAVGIQAIGISERAFQMALAYARERVQSRPVDGSSAESVAIIEHPDVRRMLLRMRALAEGTRALAMTCAGLLDLADHDPADEANAALSSFLVPLVKGYATERAVEVTSLAVQVHGGMGFIEETGVARLFRDARILPIYEGTTAIQANDFLGRRTLRDGGAVARQFAGQVAETEAALAGGDATAQAVRRRLADARAEFETCVAHLIEIAPREINAAFAASVPFLLLAGNLAVGWQLARALLAAYTARAAGDRAEFLEKKIATAAFYADNILIECAAERLRVTNGTSTLLAAEL